jgi:hypothetical protein
MEKRNRLCRAIAVLVLHAKLCTLPKNDATQD